MLISLRTATTVLIAVTLPFLLATEASAQQTYNVTVGAKTSAHPYFGQGWDEAYYLNGTEGAEITLERGSTYIFQMNNVDAMHPFYISTSDIGGGGGIWESGVNGNFATGNNSLTFTVPDSAPDLLWYHCGTHIMMGWQINIVGGTTAEPPPDGLTFAATSIYPHPVLKEATFVLDVPQEALITLEIFDLAGRKLLERELGHVSAGRQQEITVQLGSLAAGVYVHRLVASGTDGEFSSTGRLIVAPQTIHRTH